MQFLLLKSITCYLGTLSTSLPMVKKQDVVEKTDEKSTSKTAKRPLSEDEPPEGEKQEGKPSKFNASFQSIK